jgi:hypothetical protein
MLAHIGGPIRANGTELGTISLRPGTYLISANAMFERTVADTDPTIASDTYPEITLWDGTVWAPDFSNTVGAWLGGPMSRNVFINTTASGSAVLKVTSATTLHVVAFAYDENRGSEGSLEVNTASVSVVQVGK